MLEVKVMAVAQFPPTLSRHLAASSFIGRSELRQTLPRVRIAAPVVCFNIRTPLWSPRYIYSSDIADVDPRQVSELWAKTFEVRRDPVKVMESLKHSYAFVVVLTREKEAEGNQTNIVGIGRAISDGAFIATICDVAVDPAHQRRGIGRKIVKNLAKVMKKMDGPSGFAVFPPPLARCFFWMIGFRSDKNFYFMVYRGKLLNGTVSMDLSSMVSEEKDSSHGLEMRDLNLGLAYTSTPKNQLSSDLEFFKGINKNLQ